jgi:hypothetical protein
VSESENQFTHVLRNDRWVGVAGMASERDVRVPPKTTGRIRKIQEYIWDSSSCLRRLRMKHCVYETFCVVI